MMKKVHQFLDYTATHLDAIITYRASNMVLEGHSEVLYLYESKVCSQDGGHFFLPANTFKPANEGAVLFISQIINNVMSSVAEAKLGALFINCRKAIPAQHTLEEMGHKKPPTPMQTDNTMALGIVNNNITSKKLKLMGMRLHWLRCCALQAQFCHYWWPGPTNKAD